MCFFASRASGDIMVSDTVFGGRTDSGRCEAEELQDFFPVRGLNRGLPFSTHAELGSRIQRASVYPRRASDHRGRAGSARGGASGHRAVLKNFL